MDLETGWVPCPLDDAEALRRALAYLATEAGDNADALAEVAPLQPPLVEHKGFLGRTRQVPAPYKVTVVHWSDETGAGEYEVTFTLAPGPPFEARVGLPAGVARSAPDGSTAAMSLAEHHSPASAAGVILGLVGPAYAGVVLGPWQVRLVDNLPDLGDGGG